MKKLEIYIARYCGTCRGLKKRIINIKESLIEVEIIFRDIDIERDKVRKNNIENVPTIIFYIDNQEVSRLDGYISEEDILHLLDEAK
ncbi:MAG: thioredoxin family protein [Candidatus Izemoplasmatales bacterium]